jgi:hypothetical protein
VTTKQALLLVAATSAPVLLVTAMALRREAGQRQRRLYLVITTMALAIALSFASLLAQRIVRTRTGIAVPTPGESNAVDVAYLFMLVAPVNQTLTAVAALLALRSRAHQTPYDTMRIAVASAVGFAAPQVGASLVGVDLGVIAWLKLAESTLAHVVFTSMWGYAIGRTTKRRLSGPWFVRAFLLATAFTAIIDRLLSTSGDGALVATTPLVLSVSLASLIARRDLRQLSRLPTRRRSRLLRVEPPSLDQIRQALRGSRRPVTFRWVAFGTLVTTGVMTSAVALSVYVGRRTGVDFAAVDRASDGAVSALLLLGAAVLAAFPISGFLLARASNAEGVLEPALGAACAIAGIVVLLGLAAPVAVVFALAFAPVAFALACVGAWVGADR